MQEDPLAVNPKAIKHSTIFAGMGDDGAKGKMEQRSDFDSNCDGSVIVQ